MTDTNTIEAILDRIATGNQTEADLSVLRQFIKNNAEQNTVQIGKYNIVIGEGRDIRIGDVQGPSAVAIQNALRDVLQESVLRIPSPPRPTTPPIVAEFIGRESEIAYFLGKFNTTHLAVIAGIAGVGKTTLASVLARQVSALEKIFWHTFHEDEGADAVIWELAGFLAWHGQDELWQMLHRARQTGGQTNPPEMMFNYLIQMVRGRGYLLCFDDLHLVDEDPLLGRFLDRLREVLLGGEVSFIVASRRMPSFVRAIEFEELKGLNIAATRDLIAKRGVSLSDDLVDDLHRVTEGNAQFLTLAIEALRREKNAKRVIANLVDSDNVEHYLLNQIDEGLTARERLVMSGVALLLGHPGIRDAIEAILDKSGVQRTLSKLKSRFLLNETDGERGAAYGQHAIVQAFYYNLLGARQRQVMHHRAGKYYETEERDSLKASRHYLRAGMGKRAARLATEDVWKLINQGQARPLRLVLEQFTAEQLDAKQWCLVNLARGQVYYFIGEGKLAQASYQDAYSQLDTLPNSPIIRELKARACIGMSDALKNSSPKESLEWLNRGLADLGESPGPERAALYIKLGSTQGRMGDFIDALNAIEKGMAFLPSSPSQLRAQAFITLGTVYGSQGKMKGAIEAMQQALVVSQQLHDDFQLLLVQGNLGLAKYLTGDWQVAAKDYAEAFRLAERLGNISQQSRIENLLGILFTQQGKFEEAMIHLSKSLELARRYNLKAYLIHTLTSLADLQIRQSEWDAAEATLNEAEHLSMEMSTKTELPEIYYLWAQVHLAKGDHKVAQELAEKAVNLAHELKLGVAEGKALRALGQIMLADNQHSKAIDAFEKSLTTLADDPYETARTKLHWGRALISNAKKEQGVDLLQGAMTAFTRLGALRDLELIEVNLQERN